MLTSDYFQFSKIQCAVFKGTTRNVFVDKREYTGPLYEQIEEAVNFVLRNIHLGARINGIIRQEIYELPIEAIREMIVNAVCHRNFNDESCVQVAIYDDRLEVISPGGLYFGLTMEQILTGHSKLRNRTIANLFAQMGIVESWGTGIGKIVSAAAENGLKKPEFILIDDMFRINLYRNALVDKVETVSDSSEKGSEISSEINNNSNLTINETQKLILQIIDEDASISAKSIAERLELSSRSVEKNIKKMKDEGILKRIGSPKSGHWEILKPWE